jgi:hypothetical protein
MKVQHLTILIILCALSCRAPNREFNPFDQEFRFHQSFRIEDYDTITGECGYWNLTNRIDGGYYQFYMDEPEIVAKGFNVDMRIAEADGIEDLSNDEVQKLFDSHPIDLLQLKKELSKLNVVDVKYMRRLQEVFDIGTNTEKMDSVNSLGLVYNNDSIYFPFVEPYRIEKRIGRRIGYFNGKRQ